MLNSPFTHSFLLLQKYRTEQFDLIFILFSLYFKTCCFSVCFQRILYLKTYEKCQEQLFFVIFTSLFSWSKHCIQFTMTLMAPAFIYIPFKHWLKSRYSKHSPDKLWWTMWVTFFILFSKKKKTYRFQY